MPTRMASHCISRQIVSQMSDSTSGWDSQNFGTQPSSRSRAGGCGGQPEGRHRGESDDCVAPDLSVAGWAALGAAAAWTAPTLAVRSCVVADVLGIKRQLSPTRGVAFTFDDGPHPEGTPAILEAVARFKTPATFFVVGEQVIRYPAIVCDMVKAGHTVGLHGYRHRSLLKLGPRAARLDLAHGRVVTERVTGTAVRYYRPPFGHLSAAGVFVVREIGWTPVLWSLCAGDWRASSRAPEIASRVTQTFRPGEIILMHDSDAYGRTGSWRETASALALILEELRGRRAVAVRL